MLAASGRTDAHREAAILFNTPTLRPTAAAETWCLPYTAGLFKGYSTTAYRAGNISRSEKKVFTIFRVALFDGYLQSAAQILPLGTFITSL